MDEVEPLLVPAAAEASGVKGHRVKHHFKIPTQNKIVHEAVREERRGVRDTTVSSFSKEWLWLSGK